MKTEKTVRLGLTVRAQNLLLHNRRIKDKLAAACGVVVWTIQRWIQDNDPQITQASAMKVIRDETGLTDDLILQEITEK